VHTEKQVAKISHTSPYLATGQLLQCPTRKSGFLNVAFAFGSGAQYQRKPTLINHLDFLMRMPTDRELHSAWHQMNKLLGSQIIAIDASAFHPWWDCIGTHGAYKYILTPQEVELHLRPRGSILQYHPDPTRQEALAALLDHHARFTSSDHPHYWLAQIHLCGNLTDVWVQSASLTARGDDSPMRLLGYTAKDPVVDYGYYRHSNSVNHPINNIRELLRKMDDALLSRCTQTTWDLDTEDVIEC